MGPGPTRAAEVPEHAIRLVLPYGAGGDADATARHLNESLQRILGRAPFEFDYILAGSGAAAAQAVKMAAPDGQTLMLARVGSHAILPALSPAVGYRTSDFTVLAVLEVAPLVCAVRSESKITSMRELIAAIATAKLPLKYSTAGAGTVQNMAVHYLRSLNGLPATGAVASHFNSGTEATRALVDGRVDFTCNNARSLIPFIQAGTLRGLMTTAQGRLRALPLLRNAVELGMRDMQNLQGWSALVGPRNLPPAVVRRWQELLERVATDDGWLSAIDRLGSVSAIHMVSNPTQFVQQQASLYERLVTALNIQP